MKERKKERKWFACEVPLTSIVSSNGRCSQCARGNVQCAMVKNDETTMMMMMMLMLMVLELNGNRSGNGNSGDHFSFLQR